jgi:hypothetical protein
MLSLFVTGICAYSHGQAACAQQARTVYEQLYCEIKAGGEGEGLPSLADFRRNSPRVQVLLLRRPASRLGLTVPAVSGRESEAADSSRISPNDQQVSPLPTAAPVPEVANLAQDLGLEVCDLKGEIIRCGNQDFVLASNLANHQLAPHALAESNRLVLPPRPGGEMNLKNYLLQAYQVYIEKMLEVGLGASTMSFSKFYYTYESLQRQDADFPQRMEKMFEFLKQDKATMAIQSRYHNKLPDSLEQCGRLNQRLIVCDQGDLNWIYLRQPQAVSHKQKILSGNRSDSVISF